MVCLELPHINVLSKIDLVERHGVLPFNLDFFTECSDLRHLLNYIDRTPFMENDEDILDKQDNDGVIVEEVEKSSQEEQEEEPRWRTRYRKMNEEICDVVEDYGLVSFFTLDVQDKHSMARILAAIDKANGYVLARPNMNTAGDVFQASLGDIEPSFEGIADIQDRYMTHGFPDVTRNVNDPPPNFEKEAYDDTMPD